jgi:hypothetical protein
LVFDGGGRIVHRQIDAAGGDPLRLDDVVAAARVRP